MHMVCKKWSVKNNSYSVYRKGGYGGGWGQEGVCYVYIGFREAS